MNGLLWMRWLWKFCFQANISCSMEYTFDPNTFLRLRSLFSSFFFYFVKLIFPHFSFHFDALNTVLWKLCLLVMLEAPKWYENIVFLIGFIISIRNKGKGGYFAFAMNILCKKLRRISFSKFVQSTQFKLIPEIFWISFDFPQLRNTYEKKSKAVKRWRIFYVMSSNQSSRISKMKNHDSIQELCAYKHSSFHFRVLQKAIAFIRITWNIPWIVESMSRCYFMTTQTNKPP